MIRLSSFTTVWERPFITTHHFKWMSEFRQYGLRLGVKLDPFYVLSAHDPYLNYFTQLLNLHGFDFTVRPEKKLARKSQEGLLDLKMSRDFEWLMHLDSDEFLSNELMKRWAEYLLDGGQTPSGSPYWFGSKSCFFALAGPVPAYYEFKGYSDHPVKNGGTVLHVSLLEDSDWILWPSVNRNSGLNVMETNHLKSLGFHLTPIYAQDCYGVLEIKSEREGDNIHSIEWFKKRNLLRELNPEQIQGLRAAHPILTDMI